MNVRSALLAAWLCCLAGCAQMEEQQRQIDALGTQVSQLDAALTRAEAHLAALRLDQTAVITEVSASRASVGRLETSVEQLPETLKALCPQPEIVEVQCDDNQVQRVVVSGDKMVIGELENVWIDPPGMSLKARVDTGASTNSLNAEDMVVFERDGDDWVRFHVRDSDSEELIEIEREVVRFVRVFQQADPEGTRRPVVNMRLRLGDVQDSFDFTLADRSHLNYQILLGRSFLTDMALVDVGRQFVQPPFRLRRSQ